MPHVVQTQTCSAKGSQGQQLTQADKCISSTLHTYTGELPSYHRKHHLGSTQDFQPLSFSAFSWRASQPAHGQSAITLCTHSMETCCNDILPRPAAACAPCPHLVTSVGASWTSPSPSFPFYSSFSPALVRCHFAPHAPAPLSPSMSTLGVRMKQWHARQEDKQSTSAAEKSTMACGLWSGRDSSGHHNVAQPRNALLPRIVQRPPTSRPMMPSQTSSRVSSVPALQCMPSHNRAASGAWHSEYTKRGDKLEYLLGYLLCPLLPCVRGHLFAQSSVCACSSAEVTIPGKLTQAILAFGTLLLCCAISTACRWS